MNPVALMNPVTRMTDAVLGCGRGVWPRQWRASGSAYHPLEVTGGVGEPLEKICGQPDEFAVPARFCF